MTCVTLRQSRDPAYGHRPWVTWARLHMHCTPPCEIRRLTDSLVRTGTAIARLRCA